MKYNPSLDGIRAIAVLSVIAFHARVPGLLGGFLGVDVFFVLSGYLITRLLLEEHAYCGHISFARFYARRALRLCPALLLMLGVYLLVAPLVWPKIPMPSHVRDAAIAAFYLSDYAQAFWSVPHVLVHTWSLGVEEHYYLVWPLALAGILQLPRRYRLQFVIFLYVAATAWRIYSCASGEDLDQIYYRFDTRLGGLMLGSLLAIYLEGKTIADTRSLTWLGILCALDLAWLIVAAPWGAPIGIALYVMAAGIAAAGLITVVVTSRDTLIHRFLGSRPMATIGILSYGMYLWHYPIVFALRPLVPWYVTIAVALPLAFLSALVSYLTVERAGRYLRAIVLPRLGADSRSHRAPFERMNGTEDEANEPRITAIDLVTDRSLPSGVYR